MKSTRVALALAIAVVGFAQTQSKTMDRELALEKYSVLDNPTATREELEALRQQLPFSKVELTYSVPHPATPRPRIALYRSGEAEISDTNGILRSDVYLWDYSRLCQLIESRGLFEANWQCSSGIPESVTVLVKVWKDGQEKYIFSSANDNCAPLDLWSVQLAIQGIARRIQWFGPRAKEGR